MFSTTERSTRIANGAEAFRQLVLIDRLVRERIFHARMEAADSRLGRSLSGLILYGQLYHREKAWV